MTEGRVVHRSRVESNYSDPTTYSLRSPAEYGDSTAKKLGDRVIRRRSPASPFWRSRCVIERCDRERRWYTGAVGGV